MRNVLLPGLLLLSLALSYPAAAGDPGQGKTTEETLREQAEKAEEALRESAEKIMRSLESMFRAIPQYEPPEITEDGDIIIRRKRPEPPPQRTAPPPGDDIIKT